MSSNLEPSLGGKPSSGEKPPLRIRHYLTCVTAKNTSYR